MALAETAAKGSTVWAVEEYAVHEEPYYLPIGDEVELFQTAYEQRIPVLFKGPTGCGKTRFVEYMAYKLGRTVTRVSRGDGEAADHRMPLVTVACHEDLTASDLVGRYLLDTDGTRWVDGPLTRAVKVGAICYLDEVVEARKDTTVLIHPLTDYRRLLPIEKLGQVVEAADGFLLVISYNPGYQTVLKDLKPSTKQRFVALQFDFPGEEIERRIVATEAPGVAPDIVQQLVAAGRKARLLKDHGLEEATSTRALVYAASMISAGLDPVAACQVAMVNPVTDDPELAEALMEVVQAHFS